MADFSDVSPAVVAAAGKAIDGVARHLRHLIDGRAAPYHTLSHYTDQSGALGILGQGEIWATHPQYLNDATELEHGRLVWADAFDYLINDRDRLERLLFVPDRANMKDQLRELQPLLFETDFASVRAMREHVYVACFTERSDQLSQWRGYGSRQGPAYSLSFPARQIASLRTLRTRPGKEDDPAAPHVSRDCSVSLLKVSYVNRDYPFPPIVNALESFCASMAAPLSQASTLSDRDDLIDVAAGMLLYAIESTSTAMKNSGFEEEDEWRLVVREGADAEPPLFRPTDMGLAPFKKLVPTTDNSTRVTAGLAQRSPLNPVLLTQGPHGAGELGLRSMRLLLRAHGYTVPDDSVVQSTTSYRS